MSLTKYFGKYLFAGIGVKQDPSDFYDFCRVSGNIDAMLVAGGSDVDHDEAIELGSLRLRCRHSGGPGPKLAVVQVCLPLFLSSEMLSPKTQVQLQTPRFRGRTMTIWVGKARVSKLSQWSSGLWPERANTEGTRCHHASTAGRECQAKDMWSSASFFGLTYLEQADLASDKASIRAASDHGRSRNIGNSREKLLEEGAESPTLSLCLLHKMHIFFLQEAPYSRIEAVGNTR